MTIQPKMPTKPMMMRPSPIGPKGFFRLARIHGITMMAGSTIQGCWQSRFDRDSRVSVELGMGTLICWIGALAATTHLEVLCYQRLTRLGYFIGVGDKVDHA